MLHLVAVARISFKPVEMHTFQCSSTNAGMHNICTKGHSFPLAQKVRRFDPIVVLTASHRSAFFFLILLESPLGLCCPFLFVLGTHSWYYFALDTQYSVVCRKEGPKRWGKERRARVLDLAHVLFDLLRLRLRPSTLGTLRSFFFFSFSLLSVGHFGAVRRPVELTDYHVGSMEAK